MACSHPAEELLRVYEGSLVPRADRLLCGLCGELVYVIEDRAGATPRAMREIFVGAGQAMAKAFDDTGKELPPHLAAVLHRAPSDRG